MFYNNSSYPLTLNGGNVSRSRLGANWKMFNTDKYITKNNAPSNRPPAHNTGYNETNNTLLISGSNANNFRARPLKHWRKQNTPNYELKNDQKNRINKSLLQQVDSPGGVVTSTNENCTLNNCTLNNCESTSLVPNWQVNIRNKEDQNNPVGKYNKLNKVCNITCDKKVIGKAPVCDPPTKARNRVLYPSSVNNNPNKINSPTYYQVSSNYLSSRCISYPDSFVKKILIQKEDETKEELTERIINDKDITILNCENDEPNGKCFTPKCSTKIYKNSNPQFLKNSSVKSSTGLLRKKYNTLRASNFYNTGLNSKPYVIENGHGLSNFDNQVGPSVCTGARTEVPFLLKTRPLDIQHRYGGGAKINPVKCEPGLYRKPGNFTTSCMNNNFGKTIMHMQLDIQTKKNVTNNTPGYYSTIRQPKLTKSKHIPKQLTIAELAQIHNTTPHIINNLT
jgi:hypothetical protein